MSPADEEAVVARVVRILDDQHDPTRRLGYRDRSYTGPSADEILARAVGEPGSSFDHPWYRLAREALVAAEQTSPRYGARKRPPEKASAVPEYRLGPDQVARPL